MIDEKVIKQKYSELFTRYSGDNIDDFDTFLRSRVMEHFINTSGVTSDIVAQIGANANFDTSVASSGTAKSSGNGAGTSTTSSATAFTTDAPSPEKTLRDYFPILTIVVFVVFLLSRKKDKS